jgi:pimeloyl-ACP methyl ester carboxylesterase
MPTPTEPAEALRGPSAKFLLLPGAGETAAGFACAGFHNAVRERQLAIELECCDLEFEHMTDRSMLDRLRHGPVAAARADGFKAVCLAGISLGGFMALNYAEQFPTELQGICLIAPYLGTRLMGDEISLAGGLNDWEPGEERSEDEERRIWQFVKSSGGRQPPLYLGYGAEDRFSYSHRLLAAGLPPDSVDVVPGAHDWLAWRRVWDHFLDRWPTLGWGA